jgi:hypothetical protein
MSAPLDISTAPYRSVWIFAIGLPESDIDDFAHETLEENTPHWPLGTALGAHPFPDHDFVEVLDLEALRAYGFSNYLSDGNALEIGDDAERLDALTGHVLLVFSQGLENGQTAFAPLAPLTFIARYSQPVHIPTLEPLESDGATGQLPQGKAPKSDARIGGMIATYVLIFLFVFVGLFVWMAG